MKIERGNTNSWRISSIPIGQTFVSDNVLYIKTDQIDDDRRACVRLDNGHMVWLVEEIFVYSSKAKVVVE